MGQAEDSEDLESMEYLCFEIHRLDRLIAHSHCPGSVHQTANQLTARHGYLLRYLYENQSQDIFQRDIEKKFSLSRSTVTVTLQVMEKNGLILRESVDQDARLKRITLTQKARDLHRQIENEIESFEAYATAGVTEEERTVFFTVIQKMRKNLCNSEKGGN
ncbi:MAG: MarR family transcriptional regulator [Ruminococcus sp.]|nr:MarR family transcriptional regulator [Ruminococcus sp.]